MMESAGRRHHRRRRFSPHLGIVRSPRHQDCPRRVPAWRRCRIVHQGCPLGVPGWRRCRIVQGRLENPLCRPSSLYVVGAMSFPLLKSAKEHTYLVFYRGAARQRTPLTVLQPKTLRSAKFGILSNVVAHSSGLLIQTELT